MIGPSKQGKSPVFEDIRSLLATSNFCLLNVGYFFCWQFEHSQEMFIKNSNALANIMRHLIGQRQKIATVDSVIYRRKPDVMSNIICDWSR